MKMYKNSLYFGLMISLILLAACKKDTEESKGIVGVKESSQIILFTSQESEGETEKVETIIVRIEQDSIFVNDQECKDIDELEEMIIDSGCSGIELNHEEAFKNTKDSVVEVLENIESTLGIEVNYNDN